MKEFLGVADAADAVRKWLFVHENELPDYLHTQLMNLTGTGMSPVDLVVTFAEAVYANPSEFRTKEVREIAAGCAMIAESFNFHGLAKDNRGGLMARKLSGEQVAEDKLPEAKETLTKPSKKEESAAPASGTGQA